MIDEDLLALPEPISNEKKYENVIALLKRHVEYYASHTDITCINEDGSENIWPRATAIGSVEALKEVLDHFEEEYLGHKAGCCNPEEGCTCGFVKQNEI